MVNIQERKNSLTKVRFFARSLNLKKIIKSIIEEIDDINYENRFLYFAQNLFCYKHDIDELKYNKLLENLSFKNR